jgi:pimeloyl-ACP methyl ester carboxylesterase
MNIYAHHTAPTQFVDANGIRFAYRRFGKTGAVPLVFNMHFMGTMDHWDPAVTDGFAKDREVILFNNAGVSSSSGEVPDTIAGMGSNAIAFIRALGLKQVDVLGFSIGGLVAQEIALQARDLVRALGSSARGLAAARAWTRARLKERKSSARLTIGSTICGYASTLPRPKPVRERVPLSLSGHAAALKIGTLR